MFGFQQIQHMRQQARYLYCNEFVVCKFIIKPGNRVTVLNSCTVPLSFKEKKTTGNGDFEGGVLLKQRLLLYLFKDTKLHVVRIDTYLIYSSLNLSVKDPWKKGRYT